MLIRVSGLALPMCGVRSTLGQSISAGLTRGSSSTQSRPVPTDGTTTSPNRPIPSSTGSGLACGMPPIVYPPLGEYQIGDVQARSCCVIGTSGDILILKRTVS
jgi:hypothetical protein